MKWWKEFHVYNDLVKYYIIVKTLWLVHKKNQCLVLVNDKSVDSYAVHTSNPVIFQLMMLVFLL